MILILNHKQPECGIYQYGKRFADLCLRSRKYQFVYKEIEDQNELEAAITECNPALCIYNTWGVFPSNRTISATIVHNSIHPGFNFYLHQNPDHIQSNGHFPLPRPLMEYKSKLLPESPIRIGSFGFRFAWKQLDRLCQVVNTEDWDGPVELCLHLTKAFYSTDNLELKDVEALCTKQLTNPHVSLKLSHEFLNEKALLDFLGSNHLNIFLYDTYPFYNGISSVIDYAISVKRPIAICDSNMFSHIRYVTPSILIEESSLRQILNNGFAPLENKYNSWKPEAAVQQIEEILDHVL